MNKRILLATLAGGVVNFLLGWLVWGMLLADVMKASTNMDLCPGLFKPESMEMVGIWVFSSLMWGWMFAFVFGHIGNITDPIKGALYSLAITVPVVLGYDLMFLGAWNLYTNMFAVYDVLSNAVVYALVGGVVALVLGKVKE